MLILVLLGWYFDAPVVFVKTFLLLFRLALAILSHIAFSMFPILGANLCLCSVRDDRVLTRISLCNSPQNTQTMPF